MPPFLCKAAVKRAQSQTCLNYAEPSEQREQIEHVQDLPSRVRGRHSQCEQSRRSQQKQQKQQKQQADLRESNIKLVWILPSARLEDEVNIAI